MKVIVERTSNWGCEEKPIDEAVLANRTLHYQDRRNVSSMKEAKTEFWYNEFISSGTNPFFVRYSTISLISVVLIYYSFFMIFSTIPFTHNKIVKNATVLSNGELPQLNSSHTDKPKTNV